MNNKLLSGIFLSAVISSCCFADDAADVIKNLKDMPRPWKNASYNPAPEEECYPYNDWAKRANPGRIDWKLFEASVKYFDEKSEHAVLEKIADTVDKDPIYCMTITDRSVPSDKKFHIFVGSAHGGPERNGMHSCLALMEYLISPEAAPYLKKFEFKVMPSLNPAGAFRNTGYPNSCGREIKGGTSWDIKKLEVLDPETVPELAAYKKVMDEFFPELVLDCHGFDPDFRGTIMTQTVMGSAGDQVVRTWSNSLIKSMHDAANETGMVVFPYEEEELQRLISARTARDAHPRRFRHSYDSVETIMYPYLKYHAMPILPEVGYDRLIVDCIRGLFKYVDNLPPRNHRGLPVDNIFTDWSGRIVQSYGVTPGERRKSRVELWGKVDNIQTMVLYPQASYHGGFSVLFGKKGFSEFFGDQPYSVLLRLNNATAFANRKDDENFSWSAITQFLKLGPERFFNGSAFGIDFKNIPECDAPQNGVTLAADIPVSDKFKVKMLDVRLNGKALKESAVDGYEVVPHNAGHRLFINVPPEKSKKLNTYVVTYAYDSDAELTWAWQPNQEIIERAKKVPKLHPAPKRNIIKFPAVNANQHFRFDLRPEVAKPAGLKLTLAPNVPCADVGAYNMQQAYKLTPEGNYISAFLPAKLQKTDDIDVTFGAVREKADSSWAFYIYNTKRRPYAGVFCDRSGYVRLWSSEGKWKVSTIRLAHDRSYTINLRVVASENKAYVTVGDKQFSVELPQDEPGRELRWDVQPPKSPVYFNAITFRSGPAAK